MIVASFLANTGIPEGVALPSLINVEEIYDSHLNFLIGSGASYGLFPTLALRIKNAAGESQTIETLATSFEKAGDKDRKALLFMHYFRSCVDPVRRFQIEDADADIGKAAVLGQYEAFLKTLLTALDRRRPLEKQCNVFTTNYDGCISHVADRMLKRGGIDFFLNDGTRGFHRKTIQARNFNNFLCHAGIFDQHHVSIPQVNLIHIHGSVYWQKNGTSIQVSYATPSDMPLVPNDATETLNEFSAHLDNEQSVVGDLPTVEFTPAAIEAFWKGYDSLPIVNPTKWKFHETVFDEHYYQMLRLLSYELERPNAVLITFGFSFSDEHILNLVMRSLSNPRLQVFVCCFNAAELIKMVEYFGSFRNVKCLALDDELLDFTAFNSKVFSLDRTMAHAVAAANAGEQA